LYGDDKKSKEAAVWTIYTILLLVLKLFAPITPHITEELYQALFREREGTKSIHLTQIPDKLMIYKNAMDGLKIRKVVAAIRKYKSDNQIGLGKELESLTVEVHNPKALEKYADIIGKAIRVKKVNLKLLKVGTVLKNGTDLKVY
jgi:valyl-tRNA synthetase